MDMAPDMDDEKDKPDLRTKIDENLRWVYQTLLHEEVPDRFKLLLDRLRGTQNGEGK